MAKAILLDIDDTLFPSRNFAEKARRNAVDAMVSMGLPATPSRAYALLSKIIKARGSNYPNHFDELLSKLKVKNKAKFIAAGVMAYHNTKASILPFPKTYSTLNTLKESGKQLYVASQGRAVKQWDKLIRLGLHNLFAGVFVSEDLGCSKSKKFYSLILKELKLKPSDVIMVGDKFEADIAPAKALGIHTIHITGGRKARKGAEHRIRSIASLSSAVKHIEGK